MASFYTEQQSLDVKEGLARRVQAGLFVGKAPYGYRNVRRDGRGMVETESQPARAVRRAFELYAYHGHTLDSLVAKLLEEGFAYTQDLVGFPRSKLHAILHDRSYLGEIPFRGNWFPGVHEQLVDQATFDRVQGLLGAKVYQSHELTYGSELLACGECGHPITGEVKTKRTKQGDQAYVYYRCSKYNQKGHARVRLNERELDQQVLRLLRSLRIEDDALRDWFREVIRSKANESHRADLEKTAELNRQLTSLRQQQDRLLNLRLMDEVNQETFASKSTELRERIARLSLEVEANDRNRAETAELAEKVFELSQTLETKWFVSNSAEKRQLLKTVCLNFSLQGASLVPTIRKPFDVLAKGLSVQLSRGDRI
jgi:site-specific DNA recombinase